MEQRCGPLTLFSNFDSGNLARAEFVENGEDPGGEMKAGKDDGGPRLVCDYELNVWTRPDCMGTEFENGNRTWFHFGIKAGPSGKTVRINVMNLNKQSRLYSQGMAPVVRVSNYGRDVPWERIKSKIKYQAIEGNFILSFTHKLPESRSAIVYIAFCFPFSYSECQAMLGSLQARHSFPWNVQRPENSIYFHRELLCYSLERRRVDLITVSSCAGITNEREARLDGLFPESSTERSRKFEGKKVYFLTARVHPGETPSSFVLNGFLDFIMKEDDPRAHALRQTFVFKLVPMINPDGVYNGCYRTDTRGVNLNRVYMNPDPDLHPSVYAIRKLILYHHRKVGKNDEVKCRTPNNDGTNYSDLNESGCIANLDGNREIVEDLCKGKDIISTLLKEKLGENGFVSPQTEEECCIEIETEKESSNRETVVTEESGKGFLLASNDETVGDDSEVLVDSSPFGTNQRNDQRPVEGAVLSHDGSTSGVINEEGVVHCCSPKEGCSTANDVMETYLYENDRDDAINHSRNNNDFNNNRNSVDVCQKKQAFNEGCGIDVVLQSRDKVAFSAEVRFGEDVMTNDVLPTLGLSEDGYQLVEGCNVSQEVNGPSIGEGNPSPVSENCIPVAENGRPANDLSSHSLTPEFDLSSIKDSSVEGSLVTDCPNGRRGVAENSNFLRPVFTIDGNSNDKLLQDDFIALNIHEGESNGSKHCLATSEDDQNSMQCKKDHSIPGKSQTEQTNTASNVAYYIDLHGHASKRGCFIYANHLESYEEQIEALLFPKLMSINSQNFDFEGCNFSVKNMVQKDKRDGMSKEGSGRVAIYKAIGLVHSYTLECNYNTGRLTNHLPPASSDNGRATPPMTSCYPPKYTPDVFAQVGRALAISALDMLETNPWSRVPASDFHTLKGIRQWLSVYIRSTHNPLPLAKKNARSKNKEEGPTRGNAIKKIDQARVGKRSQVRLEMKSTAVVEHKMRQSFSSDSFFNAKGKSLIFVESRKMSDGKKQKRSKVPGTMDRKISPMDSKSSQVKKERSESMQQLELQERSIELVAVKGKCLKNDPTSWKKDLTTKYRLKALPKSVNKPMKKKCG